MGKRQGKFRSALEYHAARAVVSVLSAMPLGAASWVGRRLGDAARLLDGRHRRRARDQVRERLGLDEAATRDFLRRNFQAYGMAAAEFAHLSRMEAGDFHRFVDLDDLAARIRGLLAEGRGVILVTAHFGNWEWCNSCARPIGVEGGSIARPLDNPRLNEYVRGIRERNGLRILDKQGAIRKALGALRNNEAVGVLIDQDAGKAGLMSPFLGKPASTITVPVELAMRTDSPMIVVGLRRGGGAKRFTALVGEETHRARPGAERDGEVRRLVHALNADLGELIMRAPEQWFWIHRRWKSQGVE